MPLERILEPEVMDSPEEATNYDSMDHREVNRRFVEDLLERVQGSGFGVQEGGVGPHSEFGTPSTATSTNWPVAFKAASTSSG